MDMRKLEEQQLGIVKKYLTLFKPAYLSIFKDHGGGLSILGLGGVRVPIPFGNDLPMTD